MLFYILYFLSISASLYVCCLSASRVKSSKNKVDWNCEFLCLVTTARREGAIVQISLRRVISDSYVEERATLQDGTT